MCYFLGDKTKTNTLSTPKDDILNSINYKNTSCTINHVNVTKNTISSRGGLTFVSHYLEKIKFYRLIDKKVNGFRTSLKSKATSFIIRQIILFFINGSHKAISGFDILKRDEGYASVLEVEQNELLSSHTIKRFFRKFTYIKCDILRKVLNSLFIWRVHIENPQVIILDIDTMVLNNDDAKKRHGSDPTYKKCNGFQPLQVTWNNLIIDAHFRRGSAHSNHGNDVKKSLKRIVSLIRKQYRKDVPIILTCDSGFLDEKNLDYFDKNLGILFICFGKLYQSIKERVQATPLTNFKKYSHGKKIWHYTEFDSKLDSWKKIAFLRTIFTTQLCDDTGQMLLEIARPDSVLYTNIGSNKTVTEQLKISGNGELVSTKKIIECAHQRGCNELCNRSIKEFMLTEKLPFKLFGMNAAYYFLMLIGHTLNECYKADVVSEAEIPHIHLNCYPATFRRNLIDFAVQIVTTGQSVSLKVMKGVFDNLNISKMWDLCQTKERIPIPLL